jgi:hypothetical protein
MKPFMRWAVLGIATVAIAANASAAAVDKYVFDEAQVVVTFNVKQMLEAPIIGNNIEKLRDYLKNMAEVSAHFEAIGFDPFKDLDSVIAAGSKDQDKYLLIAHGRFDVEKFNARAEQVAKENADRISEVKSGGYKFYEITGPGEQRVFVGWPDGETLVAARDKELINDAFDIKNGKKQSDLNHDMSSLLEKADANHTVSIFALGSAFKEATSDGERVQYVTGNLTIDNEIKVDVSIAMDTSEAAGKIAQGLSGFLAQYKTMAALGGANQKELAPLFSLMEAIKVRHEGDTVTISGEVTSQMIDDLNRSAESGGDS